MKFTNPNEVRQLYAEQLQWYTIEEIAKGLRVSTTTVSNAFRGEPLRASTVKKFAEIVNKKPTDIASFVPQ